MRYLDVPASGQNMIRLRGGGNSTISISFNAANFRAFFNEDGAGVVKQLNIPLANFDFDTDQIFHVFVVTWDGTYIRVYDNNSLLGTSVDYSAFELWSTPTEIQFSLSANIDVELDDVEFHNTVFTAKQRADYQKRTGGDEVEINGVDYSAKMITAEFEKTNIYFSGNALVQLYDEDKSILDTIEKYMQIDIFESGTNQFTGVIPNILPSKNDSSLLLLDCMDYWMFALREPIDRSGSDAFVNKTASEIIADIVATELAGLNLSTADSTKFVATTNIISNDSTGTKYILRGNHPASKIFSDLAFDEGYIISIDENKDVVFRSNIANDSGIHLNYDNGDIINEEIQKFGGDLVNVIKIRGAPGSPPATPPVGAIVEDDALIAKLATANWDGRLPMVTVPRPELATPAACQAAGEFEIKKRNQDPDRGPVERELNFNVDVNQLVTLTIPHKNITAQTFMVQRINHSLDRSLTVIDVVYFTRQTTDLVSLIMEQNRNTESYLIDDALVYTKFKKLSEEITLTAFVDIEKRTFAGAEYGEFGYSTKYYGQLSGSFTSEVSNRQIQVQNKLFENWLRIIGQIATVPNNLDGANSFIAVSGGLTAIPVTQQTLTGETYRKGMMPGYPNSATDLKLIFKALLDDSDAGRANVGSLALFDASASGNMLLSAVLDTVIAKIDDEEWNFTITLVQASGTGFLTTSGANFLRDLLSITSTDFLNNANASIEIITTPVDRTGMNSGFPKFTTVSSDELIFEIDVDTVTLDGKTFSGVDLYNKTSGGIQTIDGALPVTTTIDENQNMKIQVLLKMVR